MSTHASPCWLGVDIGTSACKVMAVDATHEIVATANADYPLYTPSPAWVEQDPHEWWTAVVTATRRVVESLGDPSLVRGIGLCGQMHGLVALDGRGNVLRRAILWNDQRNGKEAQVLVERVGGLDALLALTDNGMLPGFTAGKLLWLSEHEPDLFGRMSAFLNPKDYLRFRMTGTLTTDVSDASGTGMFDVRRRRWSEEVVEATGLPSRALPELVESDEVTGHLRTDVASELGLVPGTPVIGGGGDAVLQTSSMGIVKPGPVGVTIGTAGIVAAAADHCPDNPGGRLQVSCGNAADRWHVMGVALNLGGAWEWWRSALAPVYGGSRPGHEALVDLAQMSVPGARGVRFLPYLLGERCPVIDPAARAGWFGLDRGHDVVDMTRAVIEGGLYNLRQIRELFEEAGLTVEELRVSGGGSAHDTWLQPLADIFGTPVDTVSGGEQGGALGAALLAGVATGGWASLDEAVSGIRRTARREPDPANAAAYRAAYEDYCGLYPAIQGWCAERGEDVTR